MSNKPLLSLPCTEVYVALEDTGKLVVTLDTEADTLAIKDPNDSRKELLPVALSIIDAGSVASEIVIPDTIDISELR
jgi:nitrate reductase NapAB chaperone NapD